LSALGTIISKTDAKKLKTNEKNAHKNFANEPEETAAVKQLFAKATRRLAQAFAKSCFAQP